MLCVISGVRNTVHDQYRCQPSCSCPSEQVGKKRWKWMGGGERSGPLFPSSTLTITAPAAYFDPLSGCLITEPVKLEKCNLAASQTFNRTSLEQWFRCAPGTALHAHLPLSCTTTVGLPVLAGTFAADGTGWFLHASPALRLACCFGWPGVDLLTGAALEGWSVITEDLDMLAKLQAWAKTSAIDLERITRVAQAQPSTQAEACRILMGNQGGSGKEGSIKALQRPAWDDSGL